MSTLMRSGSIPVKCKNCGKASPADLFVIDHQRKMMVCPTCAKSTGKPVTQKFSTLLEKNKITNATPHSSIPIAPAPPKKEIPKDHEDEFLEKTYRQKISSLGKYPRIDKEKIKYHCQKCNYKFAYNTERLTPSKCPYCSYAVNYP